MHSEFLKKFLNETLHFSRCWLFLKKGNDQSAVIQGVSQGLFDDVIRHFSNQCEFPNHV